MDTLGNMALMEREVVGFLAASKIATTSVLPTLDWGVEVARKEGMAVMSGFQSKLEREVLHFLLKGKCGIICVLARPIYKVVPEVYREAFAEGRVLFISHNRYSSSMTNRRMCQQRNEYIAATASKLVLASVTLQSSLYPFSQLEKSVTLL